MSMLNVAEAAHLCGKQSQLYCGFMVACIKAPE